MMLINLENISLAYGLDPLLENCKLQINKAERICLIGRNGAGKSSLLKIIEGSVRPDAGTVWCQPGTRIARLEQELPSDRNITVFDYVASALADTGKLLAEYHTLTHKIAEKASKSDYARLEILQNQIDIQNGWQLEQTIHTVLKRLELNPELQLNDLSGGWQRRAALAKALVVVPDLLLLDEPTNHLDIEAIQWLEDHLITLNTTLVFITHDRALLQRLATRIIELDRGQLTSWSCDYQTYLRHKDELLQAEAKLHAEFDKKLAQEEQWIRQGIKARRTRNEGRVRALKALRVERSKRRNVQGRANIQMNSAEQSGQLVIAAQNITHRYQERFILKDFSIRIMRGDRIGLIGPNGIGKSTLLNILLQKITPQQGKVELGTKLHIAYFDQLRSSLDLNKTVIDNVAEGRQIIEINGKKQHVISYLTDFLFTPARARTPVKALSGGECNRLLLARLFSLPANLLVMDEPTNDLDIETLELLEELLCAYQGTLLLVSHDRTFIDNVVTSTLIFSGDGQVTEYIGGYQEALQQVNQPSTQKIAKESNVKTKSTLKLSYKEQKELDELPARIEQLEQDQSEIQTKINEAEFYKSDAEIVRQTLESLKQIEIKLTQAYARWDELEAKTNQKNN